MLMLGCLRRLPELIECCRQPSSWAIPDGLQQGLCELGGRTVGVVGFGAVPAMLAPWLTAMGANVIYTATAPKAGVPYPYQPLDVLLEKSDIVSLHLPLTAETGHFMSRARLRQMQPGAILINTARGGVVDEAALLEALADGHLAAAGLDVFADEPTPSGNRLLALSNVIATPHVAWLTAETLHRCLAIALDNTARLHAGQPLLHRVA